MANNTQTAADILNAIGGKENVDSVAHCMTRLRLKLKDESIVRDEEISKINGVIKVLHVSGQLQIVIGTHVDKVYDEVCRLGNFEKQALEKTDIEDGAQGEKKKITIKGVLNGILEGISGSLTPVLPVIIAAGIFKMIAVLFGPDNLGLMTEESQLYITCNLVNDAGYYFLPFFVAYSSAKKFKASPVFAMLLTAVMLHPDMLEIVSAGEGFNIYGLFPMKLVNYTQAVIPIVLITWVLSKVEGWVKKIVPDIIRTIGVPVLVMVIMLPLGLCVFGPLCNVVMGGIADAIIWMNNTIGVPTTVVVGALWVLVVTFGMHVPIMMTLLPVWMEMGFDAIVSPATIASAWGVIGVELAYALRANSRENKELGWTCLITNLTANISEPAIYGILLRDKKAMAWAMISGAAGALVMGVIGARVVLFSGVGFAFLNVLRFGEFAVKGAIGMAAAFAVALVLGVVFGFEKAKKEA